MKDTFSLTIDNPCPEKWEHFSATAQGGFCSACQKNVIDFTGMTDPEIVRFFKTNPAQTCGRFRTDQLQVYATAAKTAGRPRQKLLHIGLAGALTFFVHKTGYAQNRIGKAAVKEVQVQRQSEENPAHMPGGPINGIVTDEYAAPLPGVSVYLKGTSSGTTTRANGRFAFPQPLKAGDVLVFAFIGFKNKEWAVLKNGAAGPEGVSIVLQMDDLALMGEVAVGAVYVAPPTGLGKWWQKVKSAFR